MPRGCSKVEQAMLVSGGEPHHADGQRFSREREEACRPSYRCEGDGSISSPSVLAPKARIVLARMLHKAMSVPGSSTRRRPGKDWAGLASDRNGRG
jgi:hypothetical protein